MRHVTSILAASAALCAAAAGPAAAQAPAPAGPAGLPWVVHPADAACRTELELTARSGAVTPVTVTSDGRIVSLTFAKSGLPERAFLPIRVDRNRFSNLVLRRPDGATGELILSEESEAALRKGAVLDIAWLADEPVSVSLAGSDQGLTDLRVCGAQIAVQAETRRSAEAEARARAEEEARRQAVVQAQLEAARAQTAAADAQRQRLEEEAQRQRRQEAEQRERAYAEARQRDYDERRRQWEEEQASYYRPPPPRYPAYPQNGYPYRPW